MENSRKTLAALAATFLLALAIASPAAFAQSSQDAYIQEGPSIVDRTDGSGGSDNSGDGASTSSSPSSEELPFTGLDLGLIAAAGASLVLLGFGMRRLTRAPDVR